MLLFRKVATVFQMSDQTNCTNQTNHSKYKCTSCKICIYCPPPQEGCKSKKQHKSYNATITRIPSKRNAEKAQFEKVPTPIDGMLEVNSDGTRQEKLNAVQRNSMLNWTDFNDKGSETELLDILKTDSTNFGLRAKQRMFEKAIQIVSNILHPTNPKYLIENLNIESSSKKDMNEVSLNNFIENICHLYFGG